MKELAADFIERAVEIGMRAERNRLREQIAAIPQHYYLPDYRDRILALLTPPLAGSDGLTESPELATASAGTRDG